MRHKIVWNDFEQALLDPRGEGHDCMDAGGRATQDAVAEEARSNLHDRGFNLRLLRCARNDRFFLLLELSMLLPCAPQYGKNTLNLLVIARSVA